MVHKSLYLEIDSLIKSKRWAYYSDSFSEGISLLEDGCKSKSFMCNYIAKGSKLTSDIQKDIYSIDANRAQHIVSCFFFGYYLFENNLKINGLVLRQIALLDNRKETELRQKESPEERFAYLWFLICIFHDFGYAYEVGSLEIDKPTIYQKLRGFPKRPKYIPNIYNKALLKKYLDFRQCRFNCVDHGIIGGINLFQRMKKLRSIKSGEEQDENGNYDIDHEHYWGNMLLEDFRLAAWIIACHNIFMINKDDPNLLCYNHHELEKLIIEEGVLEISIKKHPLFFLLCLADSIEPMKTVYKVDDYKQLFFNFESDNTISFSCNLCQVKKLEYERRLMSIRYWLTKTERTTTGIRIEL